MKKKKWWSHALWFALGTFFGGMVLNFVMSIFRRVG